MRLLISFMNSICMCLPYLYYPERESADETGKEDRKGGKKRRKKEGKEEKREERFLANPSVKKSQRSQ